MTMDAAKKKGAMALFSEKYGDEVRVLDVPGISTELCGGTHVSNTGEIRTFKILSDSAVAAGTRRVEAVTRANALDWYRGQSQILQRLGQTLKAPADQVEDRVQKLMENQRTLEKEIETLRRKLAQGDTGSETLKTTYKGVGTEVHVLADADPQLLREKADALRKSKPDSLHVLLAKPMILITVDTGKQPKLHAGNLLKEMTSKLGGRGGGQGQTAQGQTEAAPAQVVEWLQSQG